MSDSDLLDRLFGELATAELPVPAPGRVVSRGRQRRRRARGRVAIAVVVVAAIVAGGTQFARNHEAAPAMVPYHAPSAVCTAAPDAALNAELRHALPASRQPSVSVIGVSPNGAAVYLETTTAGSRSVVAESVATGAIGRTIMHVPPTLDSTAVGGLGPNGEVVWTENYDGQNIPSSATVLVWSPKRGTLTSLEPAGQQGHALSAPVFGGRANQFVAWLSSGAGADGPTPEIVEADLLTGVTDVIASGFVGAPFFVGNSLVWNAAGSVAGPYHLVALSASKFPARKRVALPVPLQNTGVIIDIVSSDGGTAYEAARSTELYYSPSSSQPARLVLRLPPGSYLVPGGLAIGPGYLAWRTSAGASFVASTRSLAAVRITDATTTWGAVQGLGAYALATRSDHPQSGPRTLYLLNGSVIAGLTCARLRSASE